MGINVHGVRLQYVSKDNILKFVHILWSEIIYGGHLFALGAVSVIMASSIIFMVPLSFDIILVSYLLFYIIYLHDYSKCLFTDSITNKRRVQYLHYKNKNICAIYVSFALLFLLLFIFANTATILICVIILFFGILYGKYFKKLTRNIPAFKNIFVSLIWSFMVVFVFVYYSHSVTYGVLLLSTFFFFRMLAIQILFDVRDLEGDRKEELLTIPSLFEKRKCTSILRAINIFSIAIIVIGSLIGILPIFALGFVPVFYYADIYISKVYISEKDHFPYIFAAFEPVIWSILILTAYQLSIFNVGYASVSSLFLQLILQGNLYTWFALIIA